MMGRPLKLESFDTARDSGSLAIVMPETALEELRLKHFDTGYKAGWDDAAAAHADSQQSITAEFADNLQRLSFTYHEARNAVLGEMEGILRGMVEKILPLTLQASLGEMILHRMTGVSSELAEVPIEVVISPANRDLVHGLVAGRIAPPLTILEEPSLGDGQAFLRLGQTEAKFDLDAVLEEISSAVSGFFETCETPKEKSHG